MRAFIRGGPRRGVRPATTATLEAPYDWMEDPSICDRGRGSARDATGRLHGRAHERGRFGEFGGRFVPERSCRRASSSSGRSVGLGRSGVRASSMICSATTPGRPSPLTECRRLSEQLGLRLLLKREDLNHTGSHKINNVLGQALLTSAWASHVWSPKPAPASTASRPRPRRRCWASNASWRERPPISVASLQLSSERGVQAATADPLGR